MPDEDHKPDEFDNVPGRDQPPQEAGEFTRAFGGGAEPARPENDSLPEDGLSSPPGSLTQLLGGKSRSPSVPPTNKTNKLDEPPAPPNVPESRPANTFTAAFEGVNAFTRDPADLGEKNVLGGGKSPDLTSSGSPGSFTRLFGTGEGILTPAGAEERPRPRPARDPEPPHGGSPGFPQVTSASDRNYPPRPPVIESGGFTEAFRPQSAPEPPASKAHRGSFTQEFGPPASWPEPEPLPPSNPAPPYRSRPGATLPGYNIEPALPSNPQRTPAAAGGFTRLIDPLQSEAAQSEPVPPSEATVVFNRSGSAKPELAEPRGESDYTVVRRRSDLRSQSAAGIAPPPAGAGTPVAPPNPLQYPQMAPPVAPAWPPAPAPAPPWQPPQVTPPAMPQAPTLAPPALPLQPPTIGDKLVSFLPFMLALTVINFLGLLAVLIILFATRK